MAHNLAEHVQELLDELAYWQSDPADRQTPNLTEDERREYLVQDRARRKVAAENCRQEIADAAEVMRKGGFT